MTFVKYVFCVIVLALLQHVLESDAKQSQSIENQSSNGFVLPPMTIRHLTEQEIIQHPRKHGRNMQHNVRSLLMPATFNAADKWTNCTSIRTIRNQGACGDCWAVSSASVLSDRFCIVKGNADFISANQVAGCTYPNYSPEANCNAGGNMADAYKKATRSGFATGGEYGSGVGCVPYTIGGGAQRSISCLVPPPGGSNTCSNPAYPVSLASDTANFMHLYYSNLAGDRLPSDGHPNPVQIRSPPGTCHEEADSYWINYNSDLAMQQPANLEANVAHMKDEIYNYGPITALIKIYSDFQHWRNTPATPYYAGPSPAASFVGFHGVRLTGWGQSSDGNSYWIIANSWGPLIGENGYYWVKMGSNVIGIEQNVSAPVIDLSSTVNCSATTFCSAAIDQAATIRYNDPTSPQFLFQGQCALKVKPVNGKLLGDGPAVPIGKQFLNVQTPIVNQMLYNGGISLLNTAGVGGYNCAVMAGSTRISCSGVLWPSFSGPRAFTALPNGATLAWSPINPTSLQIGQQSSLAFSYRPFTFNPPYSLPAGTVITAFLNINSIGAYVFAKDANGNPLTGIIIWPVPLSTGSFVWAMPLKPPTNIQTCV